jgi:deoxyribonuclease-1
MQDQYGLSISDKQRKLFEAWDRADPTDAWELERERRIYEVLAR